METTALVSEKHVTFLSYLLLIFFLGIYLVSKVHLWKTEFVVLLVRQLAMSRVTMNLLISVMFMLWFKFSFGAKFLKLVQLLFSFVR